MTVSHILKEKGDRVVTMDVDQTISEAAGRLTSEGIGAVLVRRQDGRVAGIVSERDIVRGIARHGAAALAMRLDQLMTAEVVFCAPSDSIDAVMAKMTERRFRHLPVLDGGQLVGIVSIGDVVKQRIAETEREAQELRAYIATG